MSNSQNINRINNTIGILSDLYNRELDLGKADDVLMAINNLKAVREDIIKERNVRIERMMKDTFKKAVEHLGRTNEIKSPS